MPIYETGHARNLEHFQQMISFVESWGAAYQPSNTTIAVTALNAKATAVAAAIGQVTTANVDLKAAINARENTFSGLRKLVTRVVNFYRSTGPAQNELDNVISLQRKINGKRAETIEDDPSTPENETDNSISASQQSYTQLVEHFSSLIETLSADGGYDPTETDLTTTSLSTLRTALQTANQNVIDAYVPISTKRNARDAAMYAEGTGLVDLALLVKNYTKAAFGTDSMQYSQIKGLKFSRPRG